MTTDDTTDTDADEPGLGAATRRKLLGATAALATGGLIGFRAGVDQAAAASGINSVATRSTPAEEIYCDRVRFVDNDRALSNNGDFRYNP